MADKIFADGIYFEDPRAGAPDYVIGSISLKVESVVPFLKKHANNGGYVNVNIKKAKETGKPYCELNVYEPKAVTPTETEVKEPEIEYPADDINAEDIPF